MMRTSGWWVPQAGAGCIWLSVLALVGCTIETEPEPGPETPGELGEGSFLYECVSNDDPMCPSELQATEFPEQVAVGSLFDVSFTPDSGDATSAVEVSSGSETYISNVGGAFRANQAGQGVLLARRTVDSVVLDIKHMTLAEVDTIAITLADGYAPRDVMGPDEEQQLVAKAQDENGMILYGALEFEWSSDDESVVRPVLASPTAFMTIAAGQAGDATITVTAAGQTTELPITVEP